MGLSQRILFLSVPLIALFSLFFHSTSAALQGYNEVCSEDQMCESGFCNPKQKTCDCLMYRDKTKGTVEHQFYDDDLKLCFSKVGQLCTLVDDQLTTFRCIPDSECIAHKNQGFSPEFFGRCTCKYGTQASADGKRCISNVEVRTGKAKVSSMDQVRPEGWNKSGNEATCIPTKLILLLGIVAPMIFR